MTVQSQPLCTMENPSTFIHKHVISVIVADSLNKLTVAHESLGFKIGSFPLTTLDVKKGVSKLAKNKTLLSVCLWARDVVASAAAFRHTRKHTLTLALSVSHLEKKKTRAILTPAVRLISLVASVSSCLTVFLLVLHHFRVEAVSFTAAPAEGWQQSWGGPFAFAFQCEHVTKPRSSFLTVVSISLNNALPPPSALECEEFSVAMLQIIIITDLQAIFVTSSDLT